MNKEDLLAIIQSHRANSLGANDGDLSTKRAKALDHYHGRPYGNEVEGRSQVVSRDLMEAVDWAMPGIMKVFLAAGVLAEFKPRGPEDEDLAQQESDYVNLVMMQDNDGFMVLHDAIKDTLLLKNGYVKHLWEVETKISEEPYTGLTLDQVTMMMQQLDAEGAEVEIVGQDSRFIPTPGMPAQMNPAQQIQNSPMTEIFDLKLKTTRKNGRVIWQAVPAEEVRVSKKCRGPLQQSPFTEHVTTKTRSDLIEMGMDREFVAGLPTYDETESSDAYARDTLDDESDNSGGSTGDKSMDEIEFCEAYIRVDWDGDGVAELRKVVTCGGKIPPGDDWNEPLPAVPMTSFVAKRVPHRHSGESLDDELSDLQEIMTVLKRQLLDNIYLSNNSEKVINENANLRDFMTTIPGGVKRTKGTDPVSNAVMPLVTQSIIDKILPVLDFFESGKETRTGISKATTGLDPDVLQQTTKGAFMENLNRASQKMEMIARMLGETGVKESVLQVHGLLIRHQDMQRMVQLRGQWTPVNPQEWKERTDLTVNVGLGTGNEEERRTKLQMLGATQVALMQSLMAGVPASVYAKNYALFEDTAKTLGAEMPEKYAVAPNSPEYSQVAQQITQQQQAAQQGAGSGTPDVKGAAEVKAQNDMAIAQQKDAFDRERVTLEARLQSQRDAADRDKEIFIERLRLASREATETMKAEMQAWLAGQRADLGQPGIGAGMQQTSFVPAPAELQQQPMQQAPQQNAPADGGSVGV
ncbi:MAG: hypothetical protein H7255_20735 [Ramlibacter sp.]|nr:hypothetical protein [Ramlibacter sp.]